MTRAVTAGVVPALLLVAAAPSPSRWFGTWHLRLTKPSDRPETLIYSDAGGGAMRMESVEDKSVLVTHFDGRPAADAHEHDGHRFALAVTAESPTSYRWIVLIDGEQRIAGLNTLSSDGRTFTEVSWPISKPGQIKTFIYERQ